MTQNNKKIAVTGGIGSGKSSVIEIIKRRGLPVFSCDKIYSELLSKKLFLQKLVQEFGNVLTPNGELDRAALSGIVFSDTDKLKALNAITHPAIMEEAMQKMSAFKLAFLEVPLLFEGGYQSLFDGVIVVLRPTDQKIQAIVKRDKISPQEAQNRIKSQFDYQNNDFAEYYVIHNSSNFEFLEEQTQKIIDKIVSL